MREGRAGLFAAPAPSQVRHFVGGPLLRRFATPEGRAEGRGLVGAVWSRPTVVKQASEGGKPVKVAHSDLR
jgi:hypothetical protein